MFFPEPSASHGAFALRTWTLQCPRRLLLSRNGGFSETTERKWQCGTRQTHQDMELLLLGERKAALKEDRHREPVSYEGISVAGSKAPARCGREPSENQQCGTNRQHASQTIPSRENAETQ